MNKERALSFFDDFLELLDEKGLDGEVDGESLRISLPQGLLLLNYHGTMDQIWLSSPQTGAHHFRWNGEEWISTREDTTLISQLERELSF